MSFKNKFLAKSPLKNYKNPGDYKVFNMGNKPSASFKQVADEDRSVPIPRKDTVNEVNIKRLAEKYKIDNVEIIENIIKKLDEEAQGDNDYDMSDVETAIKNMVDKRGDENVDEGGIPEL